MARKVTERRFLHDFCKLEKQLVPGESLAVTRGGIVIGRYVKKKAHSGSQLPDFEKDASRLGFDSKIGDRLLARMLRDETLM